MDYFAEVLALSRMFLHNRIDLGLEMRKRSLNLPSKPAADSFHQLRLNDRPAPAPFLVLLEDVVVL